MKKRWGTPATQRHGHHGCVRAVCRGGIAQYAHVGDSRIYLFHGHTSCCQLTKDHSMVQELVEQGAITEEEAAYPSAQEPHHPRFGRGTGGGDGFRRKCSAFPGDILLLCSGRAEQLRHGVMQMEDIVGRTRLLYEAADALVHAGAGSAAGWTTLRSC